jgi:hypothetical protein
MTVLLLFDKHLNFFPALYNMSAGLYGGGGYPRLAASSTASPSSHTTTPTTLGVAASQAQSLGINPSSKSGQILRCCIVNREKMGERYFSHIHRGNPNCRIAKNPDSEEVHPLYLTFCNIGFFPIIKFCQVVCILDKSF